MENMISSGYAEKCNDKCKEGRCCYFWHHGMYHTHYLEK